MEFNLNRFYYTAELVHFEDVSYLNAYKLFIFLHSFLIYQQRNVTKDAGSIGND
jgi:hypothetical protein